MIEGDDRSAGGFVISIGRPGARAPGRGEPRRVGRAVKYRATAVLCAGSSSRATEGFSKPRRDLREVGDEGLEPPTSRV